jgi:hypothetical protein
MNDLIETFEIQTSYNNENVCKIDPMLFLVIIMILTIFLYIVQFKIK